MASGISFTSTGLGAAIKGLETLARTDRAKMFKMLGEEQVWHIRQRVEDRKSHTDGRYPPSKRALRENGTTLLDLGHMLNAMKASGWTPDEVTVGFGSAIEAKKAIWAQRGTPPHRIEPRGKKALAFVSAFGNRIRTTSREYGASYFNFAQYRHAAAFLGKSEARGAQNVAVVRGVNHPGTPARPFFGVSPSDMRKLADKANNFWIAAIKKAGLKRG